MISLAVTFSRIDPGGKLVMGFRKSSNSADTQVGHTTKPLLSMVFSSNYTSLLFVVGEYD